MLRILLVYVGLTAYLAISNWTVLGKGLETIISFQINETQNTVNALNNQCHLTSCAIITRHKEANPR